MVAKRRARTSLYCGPLNEIEPSQVHTLEETREYIAEEKHDGAWCAASFQEDGSAVFESRTGLEFSPLEVQGISEVRIPALAGSILVGELEVLSEVATKAFSDLGFRRLRLFDIIQYGGVDLRDRVLADRKIFLSKCRGIILGQGLRRMFPPVRMVRSGFHAFLNEVLASGGEGLVLKPWRSSARPTRADGKTAEWFRCKPWLTTDYVITEPYVTEKGQLGAKLALVRESGKLHNVLKHVLPGLELVGEKFVGALKEESRLAQEGQVVEFYGRERFESGALRHAQFSRFRPDKRAEDCIGAVTRKT